MHIVTQNPRIKFIYTFQRSGILEEDGQIGIFNQPFGKIGLCPPKSEVRWQS